MKSLRCHLQDGVDLGRELKGVLRPKELDMVMQAQHKWVGRSVGFKV